MNDANAAAQADLRNNTACAKPVIRKGYRKGGSVGHCNLEYCIYQAHSNVVAGAESG